MRRNKIVFAAFALAAILYAGNKHTTAPAMRVYSSSLDVTIQQSIATNDNVSIFWSYNTDAIDDVLHIETRLKDDTTAEWMSVYEGPIWGQRDHSDGLNLGEWYGEIEDATNKICTLWTSYTPPVVVHTNGVYHLNARQVMSEDFEAVTNKYISTTEFGRK